MTERQDQDNHEGGSQPEIRRESMRICPVTLREARQFVKTHHRHNSEPSGHKFSIGLKEDGQLIGVVTAGQPIARANDDGYTLEITRCCVLEGRRNANSMLYAAAIRAARAMGFRRILTYTLPEESGASLKAVGFQSDGLRRHNSNGWNMPGRARKTPERYPYGPKIRWSKEFTGKSQSGGDSFCVTANNQSG
ncbi:MAG: hypothetical protein LBG12_15170 [Synergistaceae bacterium]|jgi:hypothetical protein|nr:hypothetical protein [Synergistaceae bacterium]